MKKTLLICLGIIFALALTLVFLPTTLETPVSAATSGTTGDCTWALEDGVLTISGNGKMGNYSPGSNQGPWDKTIISVVIENGVTSIGAYAFYNCATLTSVTIGNSVTTIGDSAFQGCADLISITIPDGVRVIEDSAFRNCTSLISVTFPDSLNFIGYSIFLGSSNLKTVYYSGSRKEWSQTEGYGNVPWNTEIFYHGCTETTHQYSFDCDTICNNCLMVRSNVWSNHLFEGESVFCKKCNAHRYLHYEADLLDGFAITGCDSSFQGELVIPPTIEGTSVTSIGKSAFFEHRTITAVDLPNGLISIDDHAFYSCSAISSIVIPYGVTTIGKDAFTNCTSLISVTIPNSVTTLGNYAFCNCYNLPDITIPESVTSIGKSAFYSCSRLRWVAIIGNIEAIPHGAFESCTSLKNIYLPKSVTSIGKSAFNKCPAISDIWYAGTAADRNGITREGDNDVILSAVWHFNICAPDTHVFDNKKDVNCNNCEWVRPIPGDVNGVENVTTDDAIHLLFHLNFPGTYLVNQPLDFDGNGKEDMDDAIYLLFHVNFPDNYPLH